MRISFVMMGLGVAFSAVWASAFIVGKVTLNFTDPLSLLCLRFGIAGALMALGTLAVGKLRDLHRTLREGFVLGLLNNALYLGLSFAGLRTVSPTMTVLLVSTAPFITVFIEAFQGKTRLSVALPGISLGFAGVYIVLSRRIEAGTDADAIGVAMILAGTAAFAVGTIWYRLRAADLDAMAVNAVQNLAGAILLLPLAPGLPEAVSALADPGFLWPFFYLVIAVSILDFLLWLFLVRRIGAVRASSFHLLNPIFGILLSALFLGAPVTPRDLVGTVIVVVGLVFVSWPKLLSNTRLAKFLNKKGRGEND